MNLAPVLTLLLRDIIQVFARVDYLVQPPVYAMCVCVGGVGGKLNCQSMGWFSGHMGF